MLREVENSIDHSRDQLLRVGVADAGFLPADPVFEIACCDVLTDLSAALLSGIVTDTIVSPCLPQLRCEPCGNCICSGATHLLVHPGQLLDREEVPVGEGDLTSIE